MSVPRRIYSSPLLRARTAADVLFPGEPVAVDSRLMERSVGEWEGLHHDLVKQRWPEFRRAEIDLSLTPPGGESLEELAARVRGFLNELAVFAEDVYVITHNGWIRMARLLNAELEPDRLFAEQVPFLVPIPYER